MVEIIDYESGSLEEKLLRMESCGKSGTKYTDGHGHVGGIPYFCGEINCPRCKPHRINNAKEKFSWMLNDEFVFKEVSKLNLESKDKVEDAYYLLHHFKEDINTRNPELWFRVAMTGNSIVVVLKKEDSEMVHAPNISGLDYIEKYIDFSYITDRDVLESLLIDHKNKRRILGHGKTPDHAPKACCPSITEKVKNKDIKHALKSRAEIITVEELKAIPEMTYRPIEDLIYAVQDPEDETEHIDLSFVDFLKERLNENYIEEWEEYHGDFNSKRMEDYLVWLYETKLIKENNNEWAFLGDFAIPILNEREEKKRKKSKKTNL